MEASSQVVLADPQASIARILKPARDFEALYQGQPRSIPIPLVAVDAQSREFVALDQWAAKEGVASFLARFVSVPLGASVMLILPIPSTQSGTVGPSYSYQLGWRLRTSADWARDMKVQQPLHPFQLPAQQGAPGPTGPSDATEQLTVMPAYVSEVVVPARVGSDNRVIVGTGGTRGQMSQGIYTPATTTEQPLDAAYGPSCFPPILRPSVGNELSVGIFVADESNWDFAGVDAALSNLYGTNVGGTAHPFYPGVGAFLVTMSRSTTP
jgi:hypothetical protein